MYNYPNILVAFLDEQTTGERFARWPHHITVLSWFKANEEALASVEAITNQHLPIAAELGETAMFGVRSDILVRVVNSDGLKELHKDLLAKHEGVLGLASSNFSGENYRPHVTLNGQNDPEPGAITIERLSLVRGTGQKPAKQVYKQFSA